MWLSLFLVLFLGAIAYIQIIQGVTSAAIMAALTALSLALSFCTFEYVAQAVFVGIKPEFAHAASLMLTFLMPLAICRFLLDMWIPRANQLPALVDKLASAAFGVATAFMVTGVLAITIQMIPWGDGFLGFRRFNPEDPDTQNELWLKPDRVAASLVSTFSAGVFSGERAFHMDHPDFVSELGWACGTGSGIATVVGTGTVRLDSASRIQYVYDLTEEQSGREKYYRAEPVEPGPGKMFAQVTLAVNGAVQDVDDKSRFLTDSVRMVGDDKGRTKCYRAMAVIDSDDVSRYVRKWSRGNDTRTAAGTVFHPTGNQVDVVFEVPESFEPRFVAYKLDGRVDINKSYFRSRAEKEAEAKPKREEAAKPTPTPEAKSASSSSSSSGGRVAGVKFKSSHFGGDLPLSLTSYTTGGDTELEGSSLRQGHLTGKVEDQKGGRDAKVAKLLVPEGKGLLQLNVESLKAGSTLGKALNQARQTMENYIVTDDRGNQYTPIGKYAVAKIGGEYFIELQYFPEYALSGARAIKPFSKIKNSHLKGDYQLVYMYLMDSGRKAVKFTTGKHPVDLGRENLVAP